MPASEARKIANQANAAKSTGPRTEEGKARSRQNSYKHGMTGEGIVLPIEDAAEVDRRLLAFEAELKPSGEVAKALVRRAAVLSVRMDRGVSQETAALSERVRQAEADFLAPEGLDEAEVDRLRAEAGRRAMFDPSREATLARKYEAAAERGFFRALKELRLLQEQAQAAVPMVDDETFRKTLASFFQMEKMLGEREAALHALEARLDETAPMPPSKGRNRFQSANLTPIDDIFEVPIAIGRTR